jgi:nucleotide-binding universal stress UspA family protein
VIEMKRFKNILYVVENVKTCKFSLERAVTLAENNQASLTVIEVIARLTAGIGMPDGGPISADLQTAMKSAHAQKLEVLVEQYRNRCEIKTRVLTGVPFLEVIREVLRNQCDLVIKMPETHDWLDRLFSSDDMHLLRKCPCPVWFTKAETEKSCRCILAAVDVGDVYSPADQESQCALNRQIFELASSLALSNFSELHIVHTWDVIAENSLRSALVNIPEEKIVDFVKQVKQQHVTSLDSFIHEVTSNLGADSLNYLKLQTHLMKGSAREEIPVLAKKIDVDLVVMGTVGRTGIPGFIMGNTAETILNQINCSVLAIKPPGFITPVTQDD